MDRKKAIQYTLNVPDKTGPFPLIEFEWNFSYGDVVSGLKNIQRIGDEMNKERVDVALKNNSLSIMPFCVFRIKSPQDGDSSEYVYFIYNSKVVGPLLAARLVYDSNNNFMLAGVHKVSDFFDKGSRFYMECYLCLHSDNVLLYNFFDYYVSLYFQGDYKGSFAEFLECDEIFDYINYFKMIEY